MLDALNSSAPNFSGAIPRAAIGRWTVDQYLRFSRRWMAGGVGVIFLTSATHILPGTLWAWNAVLFFLVGVMTGRQRGGQTESLTAGAVIGLAVGCVSAVVSLVLDPSVVAVINIIAETLLTGLIAALLSTAGLTLSRLLWRT